MSDNSNENKENHYSGLGVGFGLILGSIVGLTFNNIALGSGFGMMLGIVIGAVMDSNKKG